MRATEEVVELLKAATPATPVLVELITKKFSESLEPQYRFNVINKENFNIFSELYWVISFDEDNLVIGLVPVDRYSLKYYDNNKDIYEYYEARDNLFNPVFKALEERSTIFGDRSKVVYYFKYPVLNEVPVWICRHSKAFEFKAKGDVTFVDHRETTPSWILDWRARSSGRKLYKLTAIEDKITIVGKK